MATVEKTKKVRDPERSNGKPKKIRKPTLPDPGEYAFQSDENRDAAVAFMEHLHTLHSDDPGFQALLDFAKWGRDAIGWKMFGRVLLKGNTER